VRDPKKPLAPWKQKSNENTAIDLNRFAVEEIANKLEKALAIENRPAELEAIKIKTGALVLFFNRIHNATKNDPKERPKLLKLYEELRADIAGLATRTGFDLLDESTWHQ
jgi:hypothetical protein